MNKLANAAGRSHALDLLGLTKEAVPSLSNAWGTVRTKAPQLYDDAVSVGKGVLDGIDPVGMSTSKRPDKIRDIVGGTVLAGTTVVPIGYGINKALTKEAVSPQWIASKATSGMKKRFPAAFENAGAHGKQLNPAQVQSEIAERMTRIKGDFAGDIASQKSMSKGMLGFDTKNVEAVAKRNQAAQTAQKPWQRESPLTNNMMDSAFGGGTKRAPSTNIPAAKKPTPPKQPIQPLQ